MSEYNRDKAQAALNENAIQKPRGYPIDPNALSFRLSRALEQLRAAMDIIDDIPSDVLTDILAKRIPAAVLAMRPPRKEWSIDDMPAGGSIDFGVAVGLTTPSEFRPMPFVEPEPFTPTADDIAALEEPWSPVSHPRFMPIEQPQPDDDDLAYGVQS